MYKLGDTTASTITMTLLNASELSGSQVGAVAAVVRRCLAGSPAAAAAAAAITAPGGADAQRGHRMSYSATLPAAHALYLGSRIRSTGWLPSAMAWGANTGVVGQLMASITAAHTVPVRGAASSVTAAHADTPSDAMSLQCGVQRLLHDSMALDHSLTVDDGGGRSGTNITSHTHTVWTLGEQTAGPPLPSSSADAAATADVAAAAAAAAEADDQPRESGHERQSLLRRSGATSSEDDDGQSGRRDRQRFHLVSMGSSTDVSDEALSDDSDDGVYLTHTPMTQANHTSVIARDDKHASSTSTLAVATSAGAGSNGDVFDHDGEAVSSLRLACGVVLTQIASSSSRDGYGDDASASLTPPLRSSAASVGRAGSSALTLPPHANGGPPTSSSAAASVSSSPSTTAAAPIVTNGDAAPNSVLATLRVPSSWAQSATALSEEEQVYLGAAHAHPLCLAQPVVLERLTSLLLTRSPSALRYAAQWSGSTGGSRATLWRLIERRLLPSVVPPLRLPALLSQALALQTMQCELHNDTALQQPSLLRDHACDSDAVLPTRCVLELRLRNAAPAKSASTAGAVGTDNAPPIEAWAAHFSPDGRRLATVTSNGVVTVWPLPPSLWRHRASSSGLLGRTYESEGGEGEREGNEGVRAEHDVAPPLCWSAGAEAYELLLLQQKLAAKTEDLGAVAAAPTRRRSSPTPLSREGAASQSGSASSAASRPASGTARSTSETSVAGTAAASTAAAAAAGPDPAAPARSPPPPPPSSSPASSPSSTSRSAAAAAAPVPVRQPWSPAHVQQPSPSAPPVTACAWSPDGRALLTAGPQCSAALVWCSKTGALLAALDTEHSGGVTSAAWVDLEVGDNDHDRFNVVCGGRYGGLWMWRFDLRFEGHPQTPPPPLLVLKPTAAVLHKTTPPVMSVAVSRASTAAIAVEALGHDADALGAVGRDTHHCDLWAVSCAVAQAREADVDPFELRDSQLPQQQPQQSQLPRQHVAVVCQGGELLTMTVGLRGGTRGNKSSAAAAAEVAADVAEEHWHDVSGVGYKVTCAALDSRGRFALLSVLAEPPPPVPKPNGLLPAAAAHHHPPIAVRPAASATGGADEGSGGGGLPHVISRVLAGLSYGLWGSGSGSPHETASPGRAAAPASSGSAGRYRGAPAVSTASSGSGASRPSQRNRGSRSSANNAAAAAAAGDEEDADAAPMSTTMAAASIVVWDSLLQQPSATLRGHTNARYVLQPCFGGHGESLVCVGSEDASVYVWHQDRGRQVGVLRGHAGPVTAVSWSPVRPDVCATASDDGSVRVWAGAAMGDQ